MIAALRSQAGAASTGLLAAIGGFWLAHAVALDGLPTEATASLAGRAILGAAKQADPSTLLATYPSATYVALWLAQMVAHPLTIDGLALASALLLGTFLVAFAATLRHAGFGRGAMIAFPAIVCLHPCTILAIEGGPQPLLVLCGVWLFGIGLFGFRASAGMNDLLALALSLPLLAMTSLQGAAFAIAAIPFLLLAVPPQLAQRAYGSVYVVLLFPLGFALFSLVVMSWILLHDPLGFVPVGTLETWHAAAGSWPLTAARCVGAVIGTLVIAPILILRSSMRTPLQRATGAMLGTTALAVVLQMLAVPDGNLVSALTPVAAAAAVIVTRWPVEPGRSLRAGALLLCGAMVAGSLMVGQAGALRAALLIPGGVRDGDGAAQTRLGRFLAGRDGVMIDAVAHPAVIAGRGSADGLVTTSSPAFSAALLTLRLDAAAIVVRAHRPGTSDDIVSRIFPDLYRLGAKGYRLTYDRDGWRVWSRFDKDPVS